MRRYLHPGYSAGDRVRIHEDETILLLTPVTVVVKYGYKYAEFVGIDERTAKLSGHSRILARLEKL